MRGILRASDYQRGFMGASLTAGLLPAALLGLVLAHLGWVVGLGLDYTQTGYGDELLQACSEQPSTCRTVSNETGFDNAITDQSILDIVLLDDIEWDVAGSLSIDRDVWVTGHGSGRRLRLVELAPREALELQAFLGTRNLQLSGFLGLGDPTGNLFVPQQSEALPRKSAVREGFPGSATFPILDLTSPSVGSIVSVDGRYDLEVEPYVQTLFSSSSWVQYTLSSSEFPWTSDAPPPGENCTQAVLCSGLPLIMGRTLLWALSQPGDIAVQNISAAIGQDVPEPEVQSNTGKSKALCQTEVNKGQDYAGDKNTTLSGKACLPWTNVNLQDGQAFREMAGNFCRNPADHGGVWCFVENSAYPEASSMPYSWEFCDVPQCGQTGPTDCQPGGPQGALPYAGAMNQTVSGHSCLEWSSVHYQRYGYLGSLSACRDPGTQRQRVWCWISFTEWDFCDVQLCANQNGAGSPEVRSQSRLRGPKANPGGEDAMAIAPISIDPIGEGQDRPTPTLVIVVSTVCVVLGLLLVFTLAYKWRRRHTPGKPGDREMGSERNESSKVDALDGDMSATSDSKSKRSSDYTQNSKISQKASAPELLTVSPASVGLVSLGKKIGFGFSSQVHIGTWMGASVAVKIIHFGRLPDYARRYLLDSVETTLVRTLTHPNIIQTYHIYVVKTPPVSGTSDRSDDPEEVWIVQELCSGSLRDALSEKRLGPADMACLLQALLEVALALKYLHSMDIVHGDLKCENVLRKRVVTENGTNDICKIADFGLAHILNGQESYMSDKHFADMYYAAPEWIMSKEVSAQLDMYAFAFIMYELYTGTQLSDSQVGTMSHIQRILSGWRPVIPPDTPAGYKDLMEACWKSAPEDRPSSNVVAVILLELLEQLAGTPPDSPVADPDLEHVPASACMGYECSNDLNIP